MLAPVDNEAVVLAVLSDRYRLPLDQLVPGKVLVTETAHPRMAARAFERRGGAVVGVAPALAARLREHLDGPETVVAALEALAAGLPGHLFSGTARTGVMIPEPAVPVTVLDASDPRLPEWVLGHFVGEAWVVLEGGKVLSNAVLKRYDDRLREISVGTAAEARGRGLARAVVAAAARFVLAEGRAVLYNHAVDNDASARVAEAVGLHVLGTYRAVVADRPAAIEYGKDDTAAERAGYRPPGGGG
ncbi:MAG TPA: GNAT family N-acetyltransferase [Actinomycetota bacterium]|jgi:GNAT superfamily N-acetyltransferase